MQYGFEFYLRGIHLKFCEHEDEILEKEKNNETCLEPNYL